MKPAIVRLRKKLFDDTTGINASDAIISLGKHVAKGDEDAKSVIVEYFEDGRLNHVRAFACSTLAEFVDESDTSLVKMFHAGLSNDEDHVRYWSILAYLKTAGKDAYKPLIKLARDKKISLEERAQAVKCLANYSKQTFDRMLPSDPGYWKEDDLRLKELSAWAKGGFPDGKGYAVPKRHATLKKPKTEFQELVARFDAKLAKSREERQDLANPTDWLVVADKVDIQTIKDRWQLPKTYLTFLTKYSPLNVTIESRRFWNGFQIYGASELVDAQAGYSFHPSTKKAFKDWPSDYVVIASHGGDPFVLDLSASDGNDAPVLTAEHGQGSWDFHRSAKSFTAFLQSLAK